MHLAELIACSLRCMPASSVAHLAMRTAIPSRHGVIRVRGPMGLWLVLPADQLPGAWRNLLHVFYYRDYEAVEGFRPRRGWLVVDVGAFIGLWTLRAARLVGEDGWVIALEPNPDAYRIMLMNLAENRLRNVVPVNRGLAPWCGKAVLYVTPFAGNATMVPGYAEKMGGVIRAMMVRTISPRQLLGLVRRLGREVVDLLKLDIEGFELQVLAAMRDILRRGAVRRIVAEVHPDVINVGSVRRLLEDAGFEVVVHDPGLPAQVFLYARHGARA